MKRTLLLFLLSALFTVLNVKESEACHAIALINFNQQQIVPGVGLQITAASDQPTCGCGAYWLDVEIRCDGDIMNGTGLSAGVWDSVHCFPYFQSDTMMKQQCVVQNYPWVTIPDSILCPGKTYQYRLRENHNGNVGPWTGVMTVTMPGTPIISTPSTLTLTAAPNPFCTSTQLGWTLNAGTPGCGLGSCGVPDTTIKWESISGDPIILGTNFSCDTCPNPTASPSQTTTYTLTMSIGDTNACGHAIYSVIPITVTPLPWPQAGIAGFIMNCNTGSFTLDVTNHFGDIQWQTSINNGAWTNINGAINNTHFEYLTIPNVCYRAQISTSCDTVYSNVVCPGAGNLSANFNNNTVCDGQATLFNDISTSIGSAVNTWSWDFGDGSPLDITQNPQHQYAAPGVYNVTLIVFNANGCTDTITQVVETDPTPVANFNMTNICEDLTANFNDLSNISNGTIDTWEWDLGGLNTAITQNTSQLFNTPDDYLIKLIVTSDSGCTDTLTQTLTVYPMPVLSYTATTICSNNGPTVFNNTSSILSGSIANWEWDFDDGATDATQSPSHAYTAYGNYNVQLKATSNFGCSDSIIQVVTVYEAPTAAFGPLNTEACGQVCINFSDLSTVTSSNISGWDWDFGNGSSSKDASPNPCFNYNGTGAPNIYDVTLIVVTSEGCFDTVTVPNAITINQQPVANFSPLPAVTDEYNANIDFDNTSTGATDYAWDFGDGALSSDFEPDHTYSDTGVYQVELIAYTTYGCADTAYQNVTITPSPTCIVPNAFSPNGDGLNDVFRPILYGYSNFDYKLLVFDRDGHVVFETNRPEDGWDGIINGKNSDFDSKTDMYIWRISIIDKDSGHKDEYTGHITVLK